MGIPGGECFGLLGVNGMFKKLRGPLLFGCLQIVTQISLKIRTFRENAFSVFENNTRCTKKIVRSKIRY